MTPVDVVPSSGVTWGFSGTDIFSNAQSIVTSVGPYVLLGIAVMFAPKLISIIKGVFRGRKA